MRDGEGDGGEAVTTVHLLYGENKRGNLLNIAINLPLNLAIYSKHLDCRLWLKGTEITQPHAEKSFLFLRCTTDIDGASR